MRDDMKQQHKMNNPIMQQLAHYTYEVLSIAERRQLSDTSFYISTINSLCRASDSVFNKSSNRSNQAPSFALSTTINENGSTSSLNDETLAFRAADALRNYESEVDRRNLEWDASRVSGLYTAVITSLSKLNTSKSIDEALDLLKQMEQPTPPMSIRHTVQASNAAYTSIGFALSKKNCNKAESTQKVHQLFEIMKEKDLDPENNFFLDRLSCSVILRGLVINTNSDNKIGADHGAAVLSYMLDAHLKKGVPGSTRRYHDIEPDADCYGACLEALIQTHDPEYTLKCVQILKLIVELHQQKKVRQLPRRRTLATIVNGCINCRTDQLRQEAKVIELLMDSLQLSDN
jgi:hypothetical protein